MYLNLIHYMYEGLSTSVENSCKVTEYFNVGVGMHLGSALSPSLFSVLMDKVTKHTQGEVP